MNGSHRLAAILGAGFALVQVQAVQALTKTEASKAAQSITVMIRNAQNPQAAGSGVIIKRAGEIYTVLTARHAVNQSASYKIMAPDEKLYPMVQGSIKLLPGVDLALVQFRSAASYGIAKMGDSAKSRSGSPSFVAGFPGTTEVRSKPTFYFTSGEIAANASQPLKDGYALAYNNPTLPGMSGGPVLNEQGELIGIHGRAESIARPQNSQLQENVYVLKTEFNYAIPINTFLSLAPQIDKTLALGTPSPSVSSAPKADDFFLKADEQLKKANYKGAIALLDQAIRLNPKDAGAYAARGSARQASGDIQGAIADAEQAVSLNPTYAIAYNNRGWARHELGDNQGAIADLDQAIRLDPTYGTAYGNRGLVRDNLGDKQGAIADYDQAIRLDPDNAPAYNNRGFVRDDLGDKQGAITDLLKAAALFKAQGDEHNRQNPLKKIQQIKSR